MLVKVVKALRLKAIVAAFITTVATTPLEIVAIKTFAFTCMAGNGADLVSAGVSLLVLVAAGWRLHFDSKLCCRLVSVVTMWVLQPSCLLLLLSAMDPAFPPGCG